MFGELKVGQKTYKIEYSIEASLYENCTERIFSFMTAFGENGREGVAEMIKQTSGIPTLVLELLYAGLLEHHGEDGDRTVMSKRDAKIILREYLAENKDNGNGDFASLMTILMEQMGKDGFFELIGMNKLLDQ